LVANVMQMDFSWARSAKIYQQLYADLVKE
jgi:starch synthase